MLGLQHAISLKKLGLTAGAIATASSALLATAMPAQADGLKTFHTVGTNVNVRACSDANNSICKVVKVLKAKGTAVTAVCWIEGSDVNGDNIWYEIQSPVHGSIAGYWVDSGHDPASGMGHCYS